MNTWTETEYISNLLNKIFLPILLFLGSVGNILSIIIFSQPSMKKFTTFRYLTFLSIIDLCTLYCGCGQLTIIVYFGKDIRLINEFTCKIHSFLVIYLSHFSSMLLALMSIDRTIVITFKSGKKFSTVEIAFKSFLILAGLIALIDLHILIFSHLLQLPDSSENEPQQNLNTALNSLNYSTTNYSIDIVCYGIPGTIYFNYLVTYNPW